MRKWIIVLLATIAILVCGNFIALRSSLEGTFNPIFVGQKYHCMVWNSTGHQPNMVCNRIYAEYHDYETRVWRYQTNYDVILHARDLANSQ